VHTLDRFSERFTRNPSAILGARIYCNSVPNFGAQWIARKWKLQGPAKCYVLACATGTASILEGARLVADGYSDYCLAGASDASITPLMLAAYHNMKALAHAAMRPFDTHRDGFGVGEGGGVVFIETLESAQARKARIYGEILGGAYGMDAYDPVQFDPESDTLERTLRSALKYSEVEPGEIDYVNVHGTATRLGDLYETRQLKKFFGPRAAKIPLSSTKSLTGHMLGASGAVEIIATLLGMEHGFIPPTACLENPDTECDLDYTALHARPAKIKTAVSYSLGFGGHAAAIVLRKP
jgi:3-oxoacyl-[acyl-carrier-protein] synthase II